MELRAAAVAVWMGVAPLGAAPGDPAFVQEAGLVGRADPAEGAGCVCPNPSFGPAPRSYITGWPPADVGVITDATGDGRADLVLATRSFTGAVTTLVGDGRGGLAAPILSNVGQGGDRVITVADLNGDGRIDVLLAGGQANAIVAAALGDGAGSFALSWHAFVGSEPSSIATADFDGDGRMDAAVTATGTGHVAVLRGRGDGTFDPPSILPSGFGVTAVVSADWNQDGRSDLAYVEPIASRVALRLGDGAGAFGPPQWLDAGAGPLELRTADLDGDGHLDLVVSRPIARTVSVFRGSGGATFAPRTDHATGLENVLSYALGDLDGDGRLDLVLSRGFFLSGALYVMRGAAGPGFQPPVRDALGLAGQVHLADLDGDGHLDAGVVSERFAIVARGLGDGTFEHPPSVPTSAVPVRLATARLDADARPDLLIAQTGAVVVRRNDGAGGFGPPVAVALPNGPRTLPTADLDGDSDLDVVVDLRPTADIVGLGVLRNDGNGGLTLVDADFAGTLLTAAALGDLDEDGFVDAVATDSTERPELWIFRGGPGATLEPGFSVPLGGAAPNGVQVADLNGDAHLDVVVGNLFSEDVEVLLGDGEGGLSFGSRYPAPGAAAVVVADVNEDTVPDLVTGGTVLLGNGSGTFPQQTPLPAYATEIVPLDVTGDGHLDLVVAIGTLDYSIVGVMEGAGTGAFSPPLHRVTASFAMSVAALDLDGDARPEILTASRNTNEVTILRNTACRPRRLEVAVDVGGPFGTGRPFPRQPVLAVYDDGYNPLACATGEVTASLAAGTGAPGALLLGDVSAPFSLGQAAFTDLAVDRAGSGYRVAFSHPPASPTRSGAFDVPLPVVAPADVALTEGNAGSQLAPFRFTLSGPSGLPVTVPFATRAGTAEPGLDYQEAAGTLTFAPGALEAVASVVVLGDRLPEPDEFFHLDAAGAVNATLAPSSVRGRVVDDDGGGIALLEASHGAQLVRSLPSSAQPRHLYLVAQQPRSSYEVTVDGASGDLGPGDGPALRRLAPDLTTVIQDSGPIGAGPARQIAWERSALTPTDSEYIEVASRECSTACGPDDVYRLRFRETTSSIPRFNNGSGQATLVLLQNPGARAVSGTLWFLDASGDGIADVPFTVLARGLFTLATPGVPGLAGASGSITISHDGGYGALVGKAVSLEPSSGFSFDTPLAVRAR